LIYLKVDRDGEFQGFFDDEIPQHRVIIDENCIPMTDDAHKYFFEKHREHEYKFDISKKDEIEIIQKNDVDLVFIEKPPQYIDYIPPEQELENQIKALEDRIKKLESN